jgi:catechol 2,3-dioxygenase-like lactoylglutathione lyase family enzyme
MSVTTMNHFTVLSDDLEATRRFYCDLFGFRVGWRPPFQFPGWWLYADGDTRFCT